MNEKISDLIALVVIAIIGLFTAYLCFGILDSQAEAEIRQYSVGGAIAGLLVSWSVLGSLYLQVRKSTTEPRALRERIEELQRKVIRGAPRPPGFEIEISDRQRIVLARPEQWEPREGVIFNFEQPARLMHKDDEFPARFTVTCWPTEEGVSPDQYYKDYLDSTYEAQENELIDAFTNEYVEIGGEPSSIKSLKIVAHCYGRVESLTDIVTGRQSRNWTLVSRTEAEEEIKEWQEGMNSESEKAASPETAQLRPAQLSGEADEVSPSSAGEPGESEEGDGSGEEAQEKKIRVTHLPVCDMRIICFHEELGYLFVFRFLDDLRDFGETSIFFNKILGSVRFLA